MGFHELVGEVTNRLTHITGSRNGGREMHTTHAAHAAIRFKLRPRFPRTQNDIGRRHYARFHTG